MGAGVEVGWEGGRGGGEDVLKGRGACSTVNGMAALLVQIRHDIATCIRPGAMQAGTHAIS